MTEHVHEHDLTNEAHRETCAACTTAWAELDAISAEARALPTLTPSRDLWSGIEARLDGAARESVPASPANTARARAERRWFAAPALRYAAAAALLVTVTATVTWRIATDEPAADAPMVAAAPSDVDAAFDAAVTGTSAGTNVGGVRVAAYESEFNAMDLEIGTLQKLLDERRAQLDPNTVAVLEQSMRLIDQAIAESRAALAKDPASRFLAAQLARSYSTKITLLRSTATMPVGT
jgi:hypothetical protein